MADIEAGNRQYWIMLFMLEVKMIKKSETNNAIVTKLCNVRPHPNADKLQLATVLGTQVIVGLDAVEGQLVIYFDSNLRLSHEYLCCNNLYSNKELNKDQTQKGYFGKSGRVRAQKFRGEVSNGFVAELNSLRNVIPPGLYDLMEGDEFTSINNIKICEKYFIPKDFQGQSKKQKKLVSDMFHKHWDTKQLMREKDSIPENAKCYVEEKIHGTSGRTGNVLCQINRGWKFWKPKEEWRVISGTRRMDNIDFHLSPIRQEIERRVAPHLHRGEETYYEIYGYDGGKEIQPGFHYDCRPGEWKCMLYRVTITTPDGFCIDLDRESVYKRAEELGLEKPYYFGESNKRLIDGDIRDLCRGQSKLDSGTLREGVVIWFKDKSNCWTCLKHKSEEFLILEDKQKEQEQTDAEDSL